MVTFTVDGKEVVAKPGTNMMEAVKQVGVEIPYYCYHPRLSVAANCRMCMVEVSNAPKLVPACQTPISEGVAVKTNTAKVAAQQKAVMEFLLLEHPVDCSICDQAGECKLQDYYMRYDFKPSRLTGEKVMKNKRKELGPEVVLDQERCVMCTRCVRFMAEVAKQPQLGVFGRGKHEVIDTFPGQKLDSNYSVNTVDVCPVGALTHKDFRFRARSWFLSAAPSVCTGCSRGCNTWADFFGQDTYRYRPRENDAVNQSWMCNEGRHTYKALNQDRVLKNSAGRGQEALVLSAQELVTAVAGKLTNASRVAFLASPAESNETLLAAFAFARDGLKAKAVYVGGRADGQADGFLVRADKNPNRKGLEAIARAFGFELKPFSELENVVDGGKVDALFAVGAEVPVDEAGFAKKAAKLQLFVALARNASPVTAEATHLLGTVSHVEDEGTFTQGDGLTQRFRRAYPARGEAQPAWKWISALRGALSLEGSYGSSREAWKAHAAAVPEFKEFNWDRMAPLAQRRPGSGINPLPTGSDGRPAGFREFNVRPENAAVTVKGGSR